MIQFRHARLNEYHCAMLSDLLHLQDDPAQPRVLVADAVGDEGLAFQPPLRHRGYHPDVLATLAQHGLVDMTRAGEGLFRVYVTPVGRDYYDDMCALT